MWRAGSLIFRRRVSTSGTADYESVEWAKRLKTIKKNKLYLPQSATSHRDLVVLVGWAGSHHRAVKKYASLYTGLGLTALAIVPSLIDIWSTKRSAVLTTDILKCLPHQTNILLHLFSSGTTVLLPKLTQSLSLAQSNSIKVKGIVFDSGPTEFGHESGINAAQLNYDQGGFNFLVFKIATFTGVMSEKFSGERKRQEDAAALQSDTLDGIPQLYLCSEADPVCPLERVEKVIKEQREMGRDVEMKCWKDSQHVKHLAKHPEEYREQITAFIEKVGLKS